MKKRRTGILVFSIVIALYSCKRDCHEPEISTGKSEAKDVKEPKEELLLTSAKLNGKSFTESFKNLNANSVSLELTFSAPIDRKTWKSSFYLYDFNDRNSIVCNVTFGQGDSVIFIRPTAELAFLTPYQLTITTGLKSKDLRSFSGYIFKFRTGINMIDKYPRISDNDLLTQVQKQAFRYFWDFGHPVSGLARDKSNATNELDDCSIGGTGFGLMTIPIAVDRLFITRSAALERMQKIVFFLKDKTSRFHGAYPHRVNGTTGEVMVWSAGDNGADLVETSFLTMGLLTVRQYFNQYNPVEIRLREDINAIFNTVEWNWFNKNQNGLWWLWSPDGNKNYDAGWNISFPIRGWNETLITYIMAAASSTHAITKSDYEKGFAGNGSIKNGLSYYGYILPLGEPSGGPLFLSQYSFLGINPNGLKDQYADYQVQTRNHSLINQAYCRINPKNFTGYSDSCWGLTASSTNLGYKPCSPTNDIGVISPTAALSSFAFTPAESMKALHFFYYKLGDILWSREHYGFADAFNLNTCPVWVGTQILVYNQLPVAIAIENYRTGLIWNLFSSCPEVKVGLRKLGFTAPYL